MVLEFSGCYLWIYNVQIIQRLLRGFDLYEPKNEASWNLS